MATVRQQIINAFTWAKDYLIRKVDVVNNVTSTSTNLPLSANQGKELQDQIDELNTKLLVYRSFSSSPDFSPEKNYDWQLITQSDDLKNCQIVLLKINPFGTAVMGSGDIYLEYLADNDYWRSRADYRYDATTGSVYIRIKNTTGSSITDYGSNYKVSDIAGYKYFESQL